MSSSDLLMCSASSAQAYTLDVVGKFPQHSGLLLGLLQAVGFLAFALGPEVRS